MPKEIERKFLADLTKIRDLGVGVPVKQAYVTIANSAETRARIIGDKAYLTIKSGSKEVSRSEFEYEIPVKDAEIIMNFLCVGAAIEKTRYRVMHAAHIWELDIFCGENSGLVIAEIELINEDENFELPDWVISEVSSDPRFYNSSLATNPYNNWRT